MNVREMTPRQAYEAYCADAFVQAFPPAERRPWRSILSLIRMGAYVCYGGYDEQGTLLCCAFFVRAQEFYLMDYLMTMPAQRSRGLGSCFLQKLLDGPFAQRSIVGEVETPDGGAEDELRRRRLAFYERNRFCQTGVRSWLYGVDYRIIAWNLPAGTDDAALAAKLTQLYTVLIGEERCAQWVRVWQDPT